MRASSSRWGEFDAGLPGSKRGGGTRPPLHLLHHLSRKPVSTFADDAGVPEFFGTEKHIWLQQRIPLAETMKQFPELFSISPSLKEYYKVRLRRKSEKQCVKIVEMRISALWLVCA